VPASLEYPGVDRLYQRSGIGIAINQYSVAALYRHGVVDQQVCQFLNSLVCHLLLLLVGWVILWAPSFELEQIVTPAVPGINAGNTANLY
jgi:hypothetical protein